MFGFRLIYFFINKVMRNKEEGINTIINNLKHEIDVSESTTNEVTDNSEAFSNANNSNTKRQPNAIILYQKILNYHDRKEVSSVSISNISV